MNLKIITTEDGSQSLIREDLNETYHSFHGARGESEYVFIRQGLDYFVQKAKKNQVAALEVGFGTGLNAFLTALYAKNNGISIYYETLEPLPIPEEIYRQLTYGSGADESDLFQRLHQVEWHRDHPITEFFTLRKSTSTLEKFVTPDKFDLIYFDAFAPSKQPEVWSLENLKKCFNSLTGEGILTTYCAQGQFKRNLKEAGFEVETLPGAMGKKEMVRAVKK